MAASALQPHVAVWTPGLKLCADDSELEGVQKQVLFQHV